MDLELQMVEEPAPGGGGGWRTRQEKEDWLGSMGTHYYHPPMAS